MLGFMQCSWMSQDAEAREAEALEAEAATFEGAKTCHAFRLCPRLVVKLVLELNIRNMDWVTEGLFLVSAKFYLDLKDWRKRASGVQMAFHWEKALVARCWRRDHLRSCEGQCCKSHQSLRRKKALTELSRAAIAKRMVTAMRCLCLQMGRMRWTHCPLIMDGLRRICLDCEMLSFKIWEAKRDTWTEWISQQHAKKCEGILISDSAGTPIAKEKSRRMQISIHRECLYINKQ